MHSSSSQQSSLQNLPFRTDTQRPIGTQGKKQSDSKIKRSRAGKPKAKTGCFTCRIRRVKCDESRPCCQRCTKFGVICDGYPARPEGAVAPAIDRRPLHRLQPKALIPIPRSGVFGIQPASQFESERELRYFRIFCEETATQIAGPFKSSLWGRLVPQASELEPFVRHSMVAIGAITKVSKDARKSRASGEDGGHQNLHMEHQYALKQYDKALKGMRDATARGEHDLRTALIACLLAFCFETLQGRQGPACALAVSGLSLFHQRVGRSDMNPTGSPRSSYCLEEEIINALASLDIQVLFFLDGRSLALHQQIIDDTTEALKLMPVKFSSLDKARFFWQIIIRRNFHFKAKAQSIGKAAELGGKREHLSWKETADFPVGEVPFSKLKDPSPEIRCEAQKYITDIHKWTKAASNVFKTISRSDQNSIIVASLLQIHAKMSLITLAGMTFSDETSFDAFLPDFRAIVNLSSNIHPQLIESSQNSGLYQFDLGFLPALYLVGTRCRDKVVRAKAIDLLYSSPYREGIWDSEAVANLSNWTRSVEIACNDGNEEYIPEHNRVFLTAANVDLYNRRVKVYGTQRRGKTDADLVFHEGLLNW